MYSFPQDFDLKSYFEFYLSKVIKFGDVSSWGAF